MLKKSTYEVHRDRRVMMCIGNRVNLHLFLIILTMFFLDEQIMILSHAKVEYIHNTHILLIRYYCVEIPNIF